MADLNVHVMLGEKQGNNLPAKILASFVISKIKRLHSKCVCALGTFFTDTVWCTVFRIFCRHKTRIDSTVIPIFSALYWVTISALQRCNGFH